MLARDSSTDMHQSAADLKSTHVIAAAVSAGHENRTDDGQSHLATMIMPSQHEVKARSTCPVSVVRCVAEQNAEGLAGDRRHIRQATHPRNFGTRDNQM